MLSLKIERKKGEKTRRFLDRIKALDTKREIGTKEERLYIPVKREFRTMMLLKKLYVSDGLTQL